MIRPHLPTPRTIVLAKSDLREIVSRARENDPASIFRAAKRLARQAAHLRELGRERLASVALKHAHAALVRALALR